MPILRTRYREGTGNLLFSRSPQEIQKCFPFQIIGKNLLPGISPAGYMIVSVFKLDAKRPDHDRTLKSPQPVVKIKDLIPKIKNFITRIFLFLFEKLRIMGRKEDLR